MQLQSLWPGASLPLLVSSTGSVRSDPQPLLFNVSLASQDSVTLPADNSSHITPYAAALWFEAPLRWAAWGSLDRLASLQPVGAQGGVTFAAVQIEMVACANERVTGYGGNCTLAPPPPSQGPSAAPAAVAVAGGGGHLSGTVSTGRRLAQSLRSSERADDAECELFLRVVRTPSAVALEVTPPRRCRGPVTANSRCSAKPWATRLMPEGCGTQTVLSTTAVPEAVWMADIRSQDASGAPTWCQAWTEAIQPPPPPPMLSLRSSLDPYSEAGQITGCSENFGPTSMQFAGFATQLLFFGFVIVGVCGCCLFLLVSRSANMAGGAGERAGLGGGGGYGGFGGSYGATGARFY